MNVIDGWNTLQKYFKQAVVNPYFNYVECNLIYSVKYDKFYCNLDIKLKLKKYEIFCGIFSNRITFSSLVIILNEIKYKYSLYEIKEMTPEVKSKVCNGLGSKGFGFLVPDLCYTPAGDIHDMQYSLGGNKKDKIWADLNFLWNMCRITPNSPIPYVYYWAVKLFGKFAFNMCDKKLTIKELNEKYTTKK